MRYEESLVLTPQAGAFVRGGQALADGTIWGSSSRLLVEFLLERYELYAHTKQIRKQLATLNHYMKNVAKGDVKKLCQHTRELLYKLDAAGEVTNDLLANLIEALKEAPDSNFQRWLANQVDLWSMRNWIESRMVVT